MDDDVGAGGRLAYVAHAGALDVLLNGFRSYLGDLTFADIKIMRVLRAAGDDSDLEMIVSAVVATAVHELNTSERSARDRIKNLQLGGFIDARPGAKQNQTVLTMSEKGKALWMEMENEFLRLLPTYLEVVDHYRDEQAIPPTSASDDWKRCDPLHPDHGRMIVPRSFRQRGH